MKIQNYVMDSTKRWSNNELKRLIRQGAVKVNGVIKKDPFEVLELTPEGLYYEVGKKWKNNRFKLRLGFIEFTESIYSSQKIVRKINKEENVRIVKNLSALKIGLSELEKQRYKDQEKIKLKSPKEIPKSSWEDDFNKKLK